MKSTEMRVGNWAMGNKPFQLKANDIGLASAHELLTQKERWESIPLTEEWLINFGFKVETTTNESRLKWTLGKFGIMQVLWMDEDCDYTFNLWKTPNGDLTYYAHGDIPHIKHVHQLQNLYYCLVGEELTIK